MNNRSPFGYSTRHSIRLIRDVVERYVTWRRDYLAGHAGPVPPVPALVADPLSTASRRLAVAEEMEARTLAWLRRHDNEALRQANELHFLKRHSIAAYDRARLRYATPETA